MLMIRPPAGLHHRPGGGAGEEERAAQVDVDHRVPLLVLHADDHVVAGDAGIVDQDVQPTPQLDDLVDHLVDAVAMGHVAGDRLGRCRRRRWMAATVSARLSALMSMQATLAPAAARIDGDAPAQSPAGPGHQGRLGRLRSAWKFGLSLVRVCSIHGRARASVAQTRQSVDRCPYVILPSHIHALALDLAVDPPQQAPQHPAGADFVELVEALLQAGIASSLPSGPAGGSAGPSGGGFPRGRRAAGRRRWKSPGYSGLCMGTSARASAQRWSAGRMISRVKGPGHGQGHGLHGPERLGQFGRPLAGRRWSRK